MSTLPRPFVTPEQYLEFDRTAEYKSEYYNGEMFAMAGGTEAHAILQAALIVALGKRLIPGRCRVLGSDMRVQVSETGLYTYPDVSVVCGASRLADEHRDTLLNPVVIAEVLSASTENYDRIDKFAHYRTIDSLMHYVLVSQDRMLVEVFTRREGGWLLSAAGQPGDVVQLSAIDVEFPIEELYANVDLTEFPPSRWPSRQAAP